MSVSKVVRLLFFLCSIYLAFGFELHEIQERFTSASMIEVQLPKMPTVQQQTQQFSKMQKEYQFEQFVIDPELSTKLLLNNLEETEIILLGKEMSQIIIEIEVGQVGENQPEETDGIHFSIKNLDSSTIEANYAFRTAKRFILNVDSDLFSIRVKSHSSKSKLISVKTQLIQRPVDMGKKQLKQAESTLENMKRIKSQTDRIFLSSLEIWEQIQNHQDRQYRNQEDVYLRAYFELLAVIAVYIIELLILKKQLKLRSII